MFNRTSNPAVLDVASAASREGGITAAKQLNKFTDAWNQLSLEAVKRGVDEDAFAHAVVFATERVELDLNKPAVALPMLERALVLCRGDLALLATLQFQLARALRLLERKPRRAVRLADEARVYFAKTPDAFADELKEIDDWLAAGR